MNKGLVALVLGGAAFLASPAHATVTVNGTVPAKGISYIFFSFGGGDLSIGTAGSGASPLTDPMISLFVNDGSPAGALTGTLLGTDDDGGTGLDSLLHLSTLATGNYVLAVGSWDMDESEARSGLASTPDTNQGYTTIFTSRIDVTIGAPLPEPATWMTMLLGFGLAGAALRRRRKAFALT